MSGPCTDCGGPDYQTLEARIAELEGENERLRRVIGAAVEDSANLEAERDRAHDDAGNLEGEVNSLKAERDALREQATDLLAAIAELEAEVQHQVERREEEKLRAVNAEAERAMESRGLTLHNLGDEIWEVRDKMHAALAAANRPPSLPPLPPPPD